MLPIGCELARRDQPDKPDDLRANTSEHLDFGLGIAPSESVSGKRVRFSADTMFDHYTSCLGCTDLNAYPSDLTDQEWKVIEPLVPKPKPGRRPPKHPRRMIPNAIFYLKRTGLPVEVAAHGFSAEIHGLRILRGLLRCGQESSWEQKACRGRYPRPERAFRRRPGPRWSREPALRSRSPLWPSCRSSGPTAAMPAH